MSTPEGVPEPRRTRRFRRVMTRLLRPVSVVAPIALVLATGVIPPVALPEGSTLLISSVIIAAVLMIVLLALARVWDLRWARLGERLFTRREAWTVALLIFLLAWWCMGLAMLARGEGYGGLAFVNGMFGVLVTTGVLFRWALRPVAASA
jgi:hypothetical protein